MNRKSTAIGLLISAAVAVPVMAHVTSTSHTFATATSVASGPNDSSIFANWSGRSGHEFLDFGAVNANSASNIVGLRINADSIGGQARQWSMDVNTTNGDSPFFATWVFLPGSNTSTLASSVGATFPNSGAYRSGNIGHGYHRTVYSGRADGLPKGTTFDRIYFEDSANAVGNSFEDVVTNETVNGFPVRGDFNTVPEQDSTNNF